ncbi:MAG: T9SS type A sorting domain-containing protein [Chitinophagaceae bacterium]|nr:T9SS type A sorting domain-containing protein [Chitinophagaceae bacterium]
MKKLSILCILLVAFFVSKAQTITQWYSSYQANVCDPVWFGDSLVVCGFNNGDVISGTIDFGDGTVIPLPNHIYNNANLFCGAGCDCGNNYNLTHTYNAPGSYTVIKTRNGPGAPTSTVSGTVVISGYCSSYTGYVYNDLNANCVMDAGEALPNATLKLLDINNVPVTNVSTDAQGYYNIMYPYAPGDVFTVQCSMAANNCALVACPVSLTYLVNTPTASNLDFGLNYTNPAFDLKVSHINTSNPCLPGNTKELYLIYGNDLCTPSNGSLVYNFPVGMTIVNATPAPASIIGNTATWNLNNIVGYNNYVLVNAILPTHDANNQPYLLGDTMCSLLSLTPAAAGDVNMANNSTNTCLTFAYGADPNNKEVMPRGEGPAGNVLPGTDFTYNINFQNTGSAPAFNIVIRDTLDDDLDAATLQVQNKSHHMILTQNGKYLEFRFPNIMLADSTTNFAKSMGFVQYKIKHKTGLALGTQIKNTASIYFDLNPAVVTNTTLNTLNLPASVTDAEKQTLSVYPNPVGDYFYCEGIKPGSEYSLTDICGVLLQTGTVSPLQSADISTLPKGIYFIRINREVIKIVKL